MTWNDHPHNIVVFNSLYSVNVFIYYHIRMLIQNGLLTYPTDNDFLPVQRCWKWFPVLCLNDYTLKCSATMITSRAQSIHNCNDCHSELDSFRIFLKMSLYGQNMVSESLQKHQSQKRFTQRTINGPIYPIFLVRAFTTVPISAV